METLRKCINYFLGSRPAVNAIAFDGKNKYSTLSEWQILKIY